jgi:Protein of unknown function (DUF1236)
MRSTLLTTVAAAALSFSVAATAQNQPMSGQSDSGRGQQTGQAEPGKGQQTGQSGQSDTRQQMGQSGQSDRQQTGQSGQAGTRQQTGQSGQADTRQQTGQSGQPDTRQQTGQSGQTDTRQQTGQTGQTGGTSSSTSTSASSGASPTTTGSINVSNEQRTQIRQSFRTVNVSPVTDVNFSVSVGSTLPTTVTTLHDCPDTVERLLTGLPECKFIVVRDQIVIVEPRTRRIVTVIERQG